jgi:carbamoyltransferase
MTAILGLSAFYHDSAAALVVDGEVVAAAQEERFTRKKHDADFPTQALHYCLREAGIAPEQLDYVGFYDKPFRKFERLLETYLAFAPAGFRSFLRAMPLWLRQKLHLPREISKGLVWKFSRRYIFAEHHESHAASAFFPSPFDEAAILTLDGVGEWATATLGRGQGNRISLTHEIHFPHSLGLLYSAFTYFCGFKVNSGEYKLMGLAPYGEPCYEKLIRDRLLDLKEDGSFRLDLSYFNYCQGLTMTSQRFHRLFGGPPRKPETPLTQREMDLAASIQKVTEEVMVRTARHLRRQSGLKNLCLAGGVALNCVGNGRILQENIFERIWIQPAAGDAGGALGVALFIWHQLLGKPRQARPTDAQHGSLLGPRFTHDEIVAFLTSQGTPFTVIEDEDALCAQVAEWLAAEKVVAWFHGRMEFGPRALGARSILADPRNPDMQAIVNLKIKFRESFRPFAPVVLEERAHEYFELPAGTSSPYMLLVAPVAASQRLHANGPGLRGLDKRKAVRSTIPAVTHVDCTARIQTVDAQRHGRFYKLLKAFEARTGCPVLINTSFNVRGEPIVARPAEAYRCFLATDIDILVLENCVLMKKEQGEARRRAAAEYVAQFPLD